jgi:quinol monooxygenase YgiN
MADTNGAAQHEGVKMTGKDGADGPKAFLIHIEAKPGKEQEVVRMLADIRECVEAEPATGPWYAVQLSATSFAIYEAFPDIAGRNAHVAGAGGDIFRDLERMNAILSKPAHVQKVDILFAKMLFA